jgi:hypothetical protein
MHRGGWRVLAVWVLRGRIVRTLLIITIFLLSACASKPQVGAFPEDNCLTGEKEHWERLQQSPADADQLKMVAKSSNANPSPEFEERWYRSYAGLLYCHRENWCVGEAWKFSQQDGKWTLIDHNLWVCVTRDGNQSRFDEIPSRG